MMCDVRLVGTGQYLLRSSSMDTAEVCASPAKGGRGVWLRCARKFSGHHYDSERRQSVGGRSLLFC